jgi:hypothetical protein
VYCKPKTNLAAVVKERKNPQNTVAQQLLPLLEKKFSDPGFLRERERERTAKAQLAIVLLP